MKQILTKILLLLVSLFPAITSYAAIANQNNIYLKKDLQTIKEDSKKGVADAMVVLGDKFVHGEGVNQDIFKAIKWYEKAASSGNPNAQKWLGDSYYMDGEYEKALKWYLKNANQGDASSAYTAGKMYLEGKGTVKNIDKARKFFEISATKEYGPALFELGILYATGIKEHRNLKKAISLLTKSLTKNNAPYQKDACYQLTLIYAYGEKEVADQNKAIKWCRQSALSGDKRAQYEMGSFYEHGKGVLKNKLEAYAWYILSSEQQYKMAILAKENLREQLSRLEILEAQDKAHILRMNKTIAKQVSLSSGTGFYITNNGYLLTASHVVNNAKLVQVKSNNKVLDAKIISANTANDIALLKVEGHFKAIPLISSRFVRLGHSAFTIGFPNITIQGVKPKFNKGEISSLAGLKDNARHFQTSVPIQPGNSGGPLVNEQGSVIGILVSKLADESTFNITGSIPQNVNYAVKSSVVLAFLEVWPEVLDNLVKPLRDEQTTLASKVKATEEAVVIIFAYK